jgi:hypothetical protein
VPAGWQFTDAASGPIEFGNYWTSTADVATPDLVPAGEWNADTNPDGWRPYGIASGTLSVTASAVESTAAAAIAACNAAAEIAAVVTAANGGTDTGAGVLAPVSEIFLAGGATFAVYAPAYGSAFNLPGDCLRLLKIDGWDIDAPRQRFEILGRFLLLEATLAEAPVVHYIASTAPVDEWPTTFTDAVCFLLASRLAPKLAQDQRLAADFLAKHEQALGKARSKDARETRSKENHGPRQLAARSGLVQARFGAAWRAPYSFPE